MPNAVEPASPRRVRARRGEGERLREEIIAAATSLLLRHGDAGAVPIRAIADAVGVTPPSIYLHFEDKDALMWAVCEGQFQQLAERLEAAGATTADPLESVRRRCAAYVRYGLDNAEAYRVLFMHHTHKRPASVDPDRIKETAAFAQQVEAVRRAMDAGVIAPGDPELVTVGLWAQVHGLTSLLITMPDFPWPPVDELVAAVIGQTVAGLLPRV